MRVPLVLVPVFLSCCATAGAAVFDFGDGNNNSNNSQNGGNGNVIAADGTAASPAQMATIDGVTLTVSPVNTGSAATVTLGTNSQGWGVFTAGESGSATTRRRIGGDLGTEGFEFSFDTTVVLSSFRFGSFGNNEVVRLEFVSGTDPFTSGSALTMTGSGSEGPDVDISLSGNPIVSGSMGPVQPGTVLRLSVPTPTGGGVLLNEMSAVDPDLPPGNLVTSIPVAWPSPVLAENTNPASNLGVSTVAANNSKGQSFSVPADTDLTGFVFEVSGVTTPGDFTLEIFRAMDGLPWLTNSGDIVLSDAGSLPAGISAGNLLQIDLPSPVSVSRGSYTVALTGQGAADFSLVTTDDALFPAGAASRNNGSTNGWQYLTNLDADFVFAALGTPGTPAPPAPSNAPNLIFILADDYGWTDVQAGSTGPNVLGGTNHGSGYYQTPNLARLASEGLSFTHCFVHQNCAPTRAAILSGQYPARSGNGVYNVSSLNRGNGTPFYVGPSQNEDVPASHTIVAETLQSGGYVTAHFGKYHVGNHEGGQSTMPENNGYDFNFGGKQNGSPGNYHASGQLFGSSIGPGLDAYAKDYNNTYITDILSPITSGNNPATLNGGNKHVEDALGDAAIAFMNEVRKGTLSNRPFYLQLHNYAVHTPIGNSQARSDLLTKYQGITSSDPRHSSNPYAAINEAIDQTIGRILNYLDDPDGDGEMSDSIAGETLVIFTSDNGGHIGNTDNDPIRFRKGSLYNGGIRVPLIARQPGKIPAGMQTDTLVHAVDFYPTLVEHAGLNMPGGITFDGTSLVSHMLDPTGAPRNRGPIFYHFPGYLDQRARPSEVVLKRVAGRDFKLIYTYDLNYDGNPSGTENLTEGLDPLTDPWELYAYNEDIGEMNDLCNGSYSNQLLYQEIADGMAADLSNWLNQATPGWQPSQVTVRSNGASVSFPPATTPSVIVPFEDTFRIDFSSFDASTNEITLGWPSENGFTYDIEVSGDIGGGWTSIAPGIGATGSHTQHTFTDSLFLTNPRRYYRVVLNP